MDVDIATVPMIARRAIEAELALRLYNETARRLGEPMALEILNAAVDAAAKEAGQAFAASAPGGSPGLAHFATVLSRWQAGGALAVEDIALTGDTLSFRVTCCKYMDLYAHLGIPARLHASLSCRRDAAFAAGYSPCLLMDRPQAISDGSAACLFRFTWQR